jgi:hypothetical protein
VLLVSFATARVFVLDFNSALCGSNWKSRPLVADVKSADDNLAYLRCALKT